ncbi:DUF4230 domain-containing protein [Aerococcaceae bacterium NML201209]|nr:DUF4230 domain-containing protein [Aerococcaceae bacterium NML201209]MCW6665213.1 DUF4230 domain-containing protein [Aerococcaceae bacterium NML191219]MCW6666804.1 DUF4230 domain-containing protein [Aerococcaceae bacterium NML190938]
MKCIKKTVGRVVLLLIVGGVGIFMWNTMFNQSSTTNITATLIGNRIEEARDLITERYYYTNTGLFENQREFYGWKVPFTRKSFLVSYDGLVHAGIDLSEMKVEVKHKTITVTLPPAKIIAHEIDEHSLKVFDEDSSIFNPIQITDYQQFMLDQQEAIEQKASERNFLAEADKTARKAIEDLLLFDKTIAEEYQIVFK